MLFGVPTEVKKFFAPVVKHTSRPIRRALPAMVLAFLLAPHYRRLKTIAGMVLGHRCHVSTISRRLVNPHWKTWNWYSVLYEQGLKETNDWERRVAQKKRRHWMIVVDGTHHGSVGECMENLVLMSRRKDPRRRSTRQHIFLLGMILTDRGGRIPLPRRSYYTKAYCQKHGKPYRTLNQLTAIMLDHVRIPEDVEVTVVFDSAFDAEGIHQVCRRRDFREVFPLDPNRNLASQEEVPAEALPGQKVVAWTRTWDCAEFELLDLQVKNEDHVYFRRRHVDNLRVNKTQRRYAVAARHATVSKLGACLILASYKENPRVPLLADQSADWEAYHIPLVSSRKSSKKVPSRWHGKVLACTDVTATARQVVEWYEVRWQIELLFRELKSRMQFGCYVLMSFEAVERYLDFLLMGLLLLEHQRLEHMKRAGPPSNRAGERWVQARVTDQMRHLDTLAQKWNLEHVEESLQTKAG
ncbi:MAG: transposase, partial [Planctomycetota bacterium]